MDIHLTGAAANNYDKRAAQRSFMLSVPTAGKLDPRWKGGWYVKAVKSPVTLKITDDRLTKVVTSTDSNLVFNHSKQTPPPLHSIVYGGSWGRDTSSLIRNGLSLWW